MPYIPPVYPSTIPTQTGLTPDLPDRVNKVDWYLAERYNELKKELCAVMTELGTLPKGAYATVKARLDALSGIYVTTVSGTSPIASSGGLTPTISIANAAADGATKGAAAFNATNFSAALGIVNTIQNIHTTATPTFQKLSLNNGYDATLVLRSTASGAYTWLEIGRTAEECTLAIAAGNGQFSTNAVAGDTILRAKTGRLLLQKGEGACAILLDGSNEVFVQSTLYPYTDNTYYLGRNDDDAPRAWKGLILKDQAGTGKYYRLEVYNDAIRIVDLTD
jgi:hypothetical protein